ncbi:MAG TPA: tetratricopeptide repeat protein [Burkholderiales bacterium]|nr:tetratricopeptide repeat protein [Burkholderiales bacterium]
MSAILANLLKLVGSARDGALLRYSLGNEYLKAKDYDNAILHLREAVRCDADHSASWKLLGKSLAEIGRHEEALQAYEAGMAVAEKRGDQQALKEMRVFAKRLEKAMGTKP